MREDDKCVKISPDVAAAPKNKPVYIFSDGEGGLIDHLKKHHTITITEYMHMTAMDYKNARDSLEQLVDSGVLKFHRSHREPHYTLDKGKS